MPNRCYVRDCIAEPTHVLLQHTATWTRTAVPATQAPPVAYYYCRKHAEEHGYGRE